MSPVCVSTPLTAWPVTRESPRGQAGIGLRSDLGIRFAGESRMGTDERRRQGSGTSGALVAAGARVGRRRRIPEVFEIRPAPAQLPGLLFVRVPEEKTVKNRLHFDFRPDDRDREVDRLLALGAERVDIGQGEQTWVVLADPEGNEFCVLGSRSATGTSGTPVEVPYAHRRAVEAGDVSVARNPRRVQLRKSVQRGWLTTWRCRHAGSGPVDPGPTGVFRSASDARDQGRVQGPPPAPAGAPR